MLPARQQVGSNMTHLVLLGRGRVYQHDLATPHGHQSNAVHVCLHIRFYTLAAQHAWAHLCSEYMFRVRQSVAGTLWYSLELPALAEQGFP